MIRKASKAMTSIVSWVSSVLADWYWALQALSLVLLSITIPVGFLTIIAGREANRRQSLEIETRRKENLATEQRLGEEQDKRLELEKTLAPRSIPYKFDRGKTNIDELRPFAGTQVIFKVLPDIEAVRAANNIAWLLREAGWTISGIEADSSLGEEGFFDGVVIFSYRAPGAVASIPSPEEQRDEDRSRAAADAVSAFLTSNDWKAMWFPWKRGVLPRNTIRINVGFKPSPYFDSPEAKESEKRMRKAQEEMKKRTEEIQKRVNPPSKH